VTTASVALLSSQVCRRLKGEGGRGMVSVRLVQSGVRYVQLETRRHSEVSTRYTIKMNPIHGANSKF
jgi:hypothetical protein